ncbi:unnamed protein product, partial [Nesidiocoris tenuis]
QSPQHAAPLVVSRDGVCRGNLFFVIMKSKVDEFHLDLDELTRYFRTAAFELE